MGQSRPDLMSRDSSADGDITESVRAVTEAKCNYAMLLGRIGTCATAIRSDVTE